MALRPPPLASTSRARPGHRHRLTAFSAINFLDKVVLGMVAVPLMRDLQLTPTQFGVVAGSFFWLFSISAAVVGFVGNRVPARWLLLAMAVLWSLVQFPVALASSATALLVSRVILGAGEARLPGLGPRALQVVPAREAQPAGLADQPGRHHRPAAGRPGRAAGDPSVGLARQFRRAGRRVAAVGAGLADLGREGTLRTEVQAGGSEARAQAPVSHRRLLTDTTVLCGFLTGFAAYWGWPGPHRCRRTSGTGPGFDAAAAGRMFAIIVAAGVPVSMA